MSREKLCMLLISVVYSFCTVSANSQINNASGVFSQDNIVSITGLGFGIKDNAGPILFDQFEDDVLNNTKLSAIGVWETETNDSIVYCGSNNRTKFSKFNILDTLIYGSENGPFLKQVYTPEIGKKFLSFWVYVTVTQNNSIGPWQIKLWRLIAGPQHSNYPMVSYSYWLDSNLLHYQDLYDNQGMGCNGYYGMGSILNTWMRMQVEIKDSTTIDGADGFVRARTISKLSNIQKANINCSTRTTQYPNLLTHFKGGYFITNGITAGHTVKTYWDDIYIDNSWARLEIGNKSVYDECTHLEMQIPMSWSDVAISATINQGSFEDGETAYLFVVDSDGNASSGYPVTFGSSSTPPRAPSGLRVH